MKIPLLVTLCLLFSTRILQQGRTSATIYTTPLWNTSIPQPCSASSGANDSSVILFQGSDETTCSLEITANSPVWFHTPDPQLQPHFMYLEHMGAEESCPGVFEAIRGGGGQCEVIIPIDKAHVHLRGNVNVTINEVVLDGYVPEPCGIKSAYEQLMNDSFPESNCTSKRYNYTLSMSCPHSPYKDECSLSFPPNCTSSLRNTEATFQCTDHNNMYHDQTVAIIYNFKFEVLDLSGNDITKISPDAFQYLTNLKSIYLTSNHLKTVDRGVFDGLINLVWSLYIDYNELSFLPIGVFKDLVSLYTLSLEHNQLTELQPGLFEGMISLFSLRLDNNILSTLPEGLFNDLSNLNTIYLRHNQLTSIHDDGFKGLINLITLYLDSKHLDTIPPRLFQDSRRLYRLHLSHNNIEKLDATFSEAFNYLGLLDLSNNKLSHLHRESIKEFKNLGGLFLANNSLKTLDSSVFGHMTDLTYLDLSGNMLKEIPNLVNLTHWGGVGINLKDNDLIKVQKKHFQYLDEYAQIHVSQQEICDCYVTTTSQCSASEPRSPYLTCNRLLSDRILMAFMWVIGINALFGNLFVLAWRILKEKETTVQSLLLSNLAVSDLLMGVYMIMIASADIHFGEYFPMQAESWRTGLTCRIAGAISIGSSEASVFFVVLISIDRFMNIKYPLSTIKLRKTSTKITAAVIWVITLAIGIIPSTLAGRNIYFYDNSHVCIGLPLAKLEAVTSTTFSKRSCSPWSYICYNWDTVISEPAGLINGMYFSVAVFLGLNCIGYLLIMFCYVQIIRSVVASSRKTGLNKEMKEQIKLTAKVSAIIATDFFCWFPIIIMGILVQADVVTLPTGVFAWLVTFVLPINSAINPYLYTISHVLAVRRQQGRAKNGKKDQSSSTKTSELGESKEKSKTNEENRV